MTSPRQYGKTVLFRTLRFGFRLVPMREAARDRMRSWFVDHYAALVPAEPPGEVAPPPPPLPRPRVRSDAPAIGHAGYRRESLPSPLPATLVAFYLPQFPPLAGNVPWDRSGFTDWGTTTRALPQFEGHAQPRLPADLGFYDRRDVEALREQSRLASEYGIGAFCFLFHWSPYETLPEQPPRQWLDDPSLELPFCLCWANERCSPPPDGRGEEVPTAREPDAGDDLAFIAHIAPYLRDPRYLRVEGKPLLLVSRADLLPDATQTAQRWRAWCGANGIGEIHLACVQDVACGDPRDLGFDAAVEFPPNLSDPRELTADQRLLNPEFRGRVLDWRDLAADYSARQMPAFPLYPGVNAGWDDEPRNPGEGRVYLHSAPRRYRDWLQSTISSRLAGKAEPERLVFINAWNAWNTGAVLEPDAMLGHAWLAATRRALQRVATPASSESPSSGPPCAVIHAWYPEVLDELLGTLQATGLTWRLVVTTTPDKAAEVRRILLASGMQAQVEIFPNRGRDILPFLRVADRLLDEGVSVVLKLHTKRSVHRVDGDDWRRDLVSRLASPERAAHLLRAFQDDGSLGLIGPEGHLLPLESFWGDNAEAVKYLAVRVGVAAPDDQERFFAGSMFWARLEALRPLLDARLGDADFEPECSQLDGTLAHAVERMLAACALHSGFRVLDAATVAGEPSHGAERDYHSANRD